MGTSCVPVHDETETSLLKISTAAQGPRRLGKPRSKVACRHCRSRKVRCDVYRRGAPCTNCHLDEIECTIGERKRSYTNRKLRKHETTLNFGVSLQSSQKATRVAKSPGCYTTPIPKQSPTAVLDENVFYEEINCLHARAPSKTSIDRENTTAQVSTAMPLKDIPSYIDFHPGNASMADVSYLRDKGCFSFPEKDVVDDLLKCYFDCVHPHVPFLDEQEFWETYLNRKPDALHSRHSNNRHVISLLLFQAVLLAATTCASPSILQRAGYSSRWAARRHAFHKVRALYSFDTEKDKMIQLQTLLILSFWRGDIDEDKDAWHWSGLAITLASDLFLYRQPSAQLTERQKTLRKRCWWSCVLRDRLLALTERRNPRVRLDESDVPMLTLADYNLGLRCPISEMSAESELGKRTALSMFSLQLIRLVLCVGDASPSRALSLTSFSPAACQIWDRTPVESADDGPTNEFLDLDHWRLNLPEVLQWTPESTRGHEMLPCVLLHRNSLHIYYHKLILSMCLPRLDDAGLPWGSERGSQLARCSSVTLTKLYKELSDCDSIHHLPSECFGHSTFPNQVQLQSLQGSGRETEAGPYQSDVHSFSSMGAAGADTVGSQVAYTEPSASKASAECGLLLNSDVEPLTPTNGYGPDLELNLTPREDVCSSVFQFAKEFISDSIWTLGDFKGYTGAPQILPMPTADDTNTEASNNRSATPLAQLPFENLFSLELDELTNC